MLQAIQSRRSIRAYQNKPVEDEKIKQVLLSAFVAPSAHHTYPWEFIVVKDQETRNLLSTGTKYCSFIKSAPAVIVILGIPEISHEWIEDASIATENMAIEAVNQGLGTCFIQVRESKRQDESDSETYIKKILNIPEKLRVVFMLPIGYPAEKKEPHSEKDYQSAKVHFAKY